MSYFQHSFEARLARHAVGTLRYTVVYLPAEIAALLPLAAHPRLRIDAEVAGVPITGAWQPARGRWYLMLSRAWLRAAQLAVGDVVEVHFRVAAQDAVEVPAELAEAVAASTPLARAWEALTPGRRRGLAHYVDSAKRAETRARRLAEVVAGLRGRGQLPGPPGTRAD